MSGAARLGGENGNGDARPRGPHRRPAGGGAVGWSRTHARGALLPVVVWGRPPDGTPMVDVGRGGDRWVGRG
jgi:hypothetical protein